MSSGAMSSAVDQIPTDHIEAMRLFFDKTVEERRQFKNKNSYYYHLAKEYVRFLIPEGYRVLEVGSGDGDLLAALKPSRGLGVDISPLTVRDAQSRHGNLEFREGVAENCEYTETFDYILLANLVGYLRDVQRVFENLRPACTPSTRVVIQYYNYLWEPLLALADRLGIRMRQGIQNWLSVEDIENLLDLAGFETVKSFRKIIFPFRIPLISAFLNRVVANLPGINRLCLVCFVVARPKSLERPAKPSVSVFVPTKDERGNIRELIERTPVFEGGIEMVFVDGHSTDGTVEEIQNAAKDFPHKNIRLYDQGSTRGKGAAVRIGFENCRNDIVMILDSDISVAPEDLTKFYDQLVRGTGEFINGSRLVYPMEKRAMRFLNVFGNKFFSMAFTYLLGQRLKDTLCGTKALYRRDYEKIARNRSFFGEFDPFGDFDLLFGAAKLNLKIIEMPVRYYERRYGQIKIHRFRHGTLLLGMCLIALRKLKFV